MEKVNDLKYFYLATTHDLKPNDFIVYCSEGFKLSEIDLINLIKICMIEARNKTVGRKLLEIYRDSTETRIGITEERLRNIGIHNDREKPTIARRKKSTSK